MDSILTKQPTSKKYPVPVPRGNKGPPTSDFVTKGAEAPKLPKGALAADKGALATIKKKAASAGVTKATRPAASPHKEKVSGKALYKPANKFTLARTSILTRADLFLLIHTHFRVLFRGGEARL